MLKRPRRVFFCYDVFMNKNKLGSNFTRLWASSGISSLGDGAMLAAGPLLVSSRTQQPALVAGAVFAQQLPWLLFSLLSGVFVDRFDRKKILVFANIVRAIAVGGLALAIVVNQASIPIIYALLFLLGTADTLAENAAVAFLPEIVTEAQLSSANSHLQGAVLIGRQLIGPSLGAYLFVVAAGIPFGLDAATFVVAALLIGLIRKSSKPITSYDRKTIHNEIREGVQWLWRSEFLRTLAISIAVLSITFTAAFATFVLFANQRLGLGPVGYGLMLSLSALGGLFGAVLATPLQSKFSVSTLLRAGLITEALINLAFANVQSPWAAGFIYAIFGMHAVIWGIVTVSLRQKMIPSNLLGRVNSVYNLFRMGGVAIGALAGGLIAQAYGITAPFWVAGISVALLTILTWRSFGKSKITA